MDNQFRNMLTEVLEGVLFDVIGVGRSIQEIRVDVATRTPPAENSRQLNQLRADLGIFVLETENKYFSLTSCEIWPIVAKLLDVRGATSETSCNITRARGVTLWDYCALEERSLKNRRLYEKLITQNDRPRPQQIHFLADWVARFATLDPHEMPDIVAGWFSQGFLERRAGSFANWTSASRAAAVQNYVDAVLLSHDGATIEKHNDVKAPWRFSRFLGNDSPKWVDQLTGPEFIEFCDRLAHGKGLRTVMVSDLPYGQSEESVSIQLQLILQSVGPLCSVSIHKYARHPDEKLYALATFATVEGAKIAISAALKRPILVGNQRVSIHYVPTTR
jgi:hypothetical protein